MAKSDRACGKARRIWNCAAGSVLVAALGCSSTSGAGKKADGGPAGSAVEAGSVGLPDVVFSMSGHVDPGGEIQDCVYMPMPADRGDIAVNSAESHYTPGSHHFLVFRTGLTDMPDGGGRVHEWGGTELISSVRGTYYEAQSPDAHRELPEGVAHIFKPGEILLLTAHYLNTTEAGLDVHVKFQLHPMPPEKVVHEAGSIFFYNYFITLPPRSDVTVTRTCPVSQDMNMALLWSHMHSRGVGFDATTNDVDVSTRVGSLYSTTDWSEPAARAFPADPPVTVHAGSSITYSCHFHNGTANTIVQGPSAATNEMCILHGMYWPRLDPATELCFAGQSTSDPPPPGSDAGIRN
jgi:hypothetical protein